MEEILSLLRNHVVYSDAVIESYYRIADIRVSDKLKHRTQMNAVINNQEDMLIKVLTDVEYKSLLEELRRLDLSNLRVWVDEKINPNMRKYLLALIAEIEHSHLCSPSPEFKEAEYEMFQYLFSLPFEEGLKHIQHVKDGTLRIILQEWLLYPMLICDKDSCKELLEILGISDCKL